MRRLGLSGNGRKHKGGGCGEHVFEGSSCKTPEGGYSGFNNPGMSYPCRDCIFSGQRCPDFIPYKGSGRFKKFFGKIAEEVIEIWLPALVIVVISMFMGTGIALAILKIFKI
jgi:hypothetical protein